MTPLIFSILRHNKKLTQLLLMDGEDPIVDHPWMVAKRLKFDDIADILPPSFDDHFFLSILKYLNYPIMEKGICFGYAFMAMHAIQSRQIEKFNNHLIDLIKIYFKILHQTQAELKLPATAYDDHENNMYFKNHFRKNLFCFLDSLATSKIPDEKNQYINLIAFCDGLFLYQVHPNRMSLYGSYASPGSNYAAQQTLRILMPDDTHIEYRGEFKGEYSFNDLMQYFQKISDEIEKLSLTHPLSIILTAIPTKHALTIGYDPENHNWIIANSYNMPLISTNQIDKLATHVSTALSKNGISSLKSSLYATREDREKVKSLVCSMLANRSNTQISTCNIL